MGASPKKPRKAVVLGVLAVVGATVVLLLFTDVWSAVANWWGGSAARADEVIKEKNDAKRLTAQFFRDGQNMGVRLSPKAIKGLQLEPVAARKAIEPRALPPQIGTVNYDNDRLFIIRSRFGGEVAEMRTVLDTDTVSRAPVTKMRPMRFGDKVQQATLLAVVWSQTLGQSKAALVDAINNLRLSKDFLDRQAKTFESGALSLATYKLSERQVQLDSNAVVTAERSLRMWKLSDDEINKIKEEAKIIVDQKKTRSAIDETRWARVEIRAPIFAWDPKEPTKPDPNVVLTVVEKNTNVNDMLDPINSPPLFKLADLSRLQIWVQPPEEYLPLLREKLKKGKVSWKVQFQGDPTAEPLDLEIVQVAPSLDPNLRTAMVMGYLPNKENKFLVGQFVTATIFVDPEPDTVEIPTNALNEVEGESLVFVEKNAKKGEYVLRRVAVVQRFKDVTFVRSKLTQRDQEISEAETARGRPAIQPLTAGERVVTRSLVELTAALDNLAAQDRVEQEQKGK